MARYKLILAYDGTDFHGSQMQLDTRTVQGELETAVRKLGWSGKSVLLAGRTDAGVHALGQVAAFDFSWNHSGEDLANALNSLLPKDIAIQDISLCPPDFQPRFDARSRKYRYEIYCKPVHNPTKDRFSWRVWPKPDLKFLRDVSKIFIGLHDFAGFGRAATLGGETLREVWSAGWNEDGEKIYFEITANAFLYHMVRRLVFVQIQVGQGQFQIQEVINLLKNPKVHGLHGLAPPQGLTLVKVYYPEDLSEDRIKINGK